MARNMNIAADCADCGTCPTPQVLWDTPQAIASPCGYYTNNKWFRTATTRTEIDYLGFAEQDILEAYPADALMITGSSGMGSSSCPGITTTAEWTTNAAAEECAGSIPYTQAGVWPGMEYSHGLTWPSFPFIDEPSCEPISYIYPFQEEEPSEEVTAEGVIFEKVITTASDVPVGFSRITYGNAWTLAELETALLALTMTYSGSYQPEGGSRLPGSCLVVTEDIDGSLLGIRRRAKYRFTASPTTSLVGGKNYSLTWVERLLPVGGPGVTGVAIDGATLVHRGCYRPLVVLGHGSAPAAKQAAAAALMASDGTIASINILRPGDYRPTITFAAPPSGGVRATAEVLTLTTGGAVATWRITNAGSGYLTAPAVTFGTSARTTATATASLSGSGVGSISLTNAGDYRPTVTIQGSSGWAPAMTTSGQVSAITGGTATSYLPVAVIQSIYGSGAIIALTMDITGGLASATLSAAGSGYAATSSGIQPQVAFNTPYTVIQDARVDLACGTETPMSASSSVGATAFGPYDLADPTSGSIRLLANVLATCS